MGRIILHIVSAALGLYLAARLVPGVEFYGTYLSLIMIGAALGLVNYFIKPIIKTISLPVIILTLGLFSIVINMAIVWVIADVLFPETMEISGLLPLFWTTAIIWAIGLILGLYSNKHKYENE